MADIFRRHGDAYRRAAELLPVPYFHVVFTLPPAAATIAFQNKAVVYAILMRTAAETLSTVAADPRHLGAELGITAVLHTWGQTCSIIPMSIAWRPAALRSTASAGSPAGKASFCRCRCCRASSDACSSPRCTRPSMPAASSSAAISPSWRTPSSLRGSSMRSAGSTGLSTPSHPSAGPRRVLAYLGRYTHRVAIANNRLLALDEGWVRFAWKDYRHGGHTKVMALEAGEFIRRFLLHTLPDGFHRIRHYGFLANGARTEGLDQCRGLLDMALPSVGAESAHDAHDRKLTWRDFAICPACGGAMRRVAIVPRSSVSPVRCDTS